ncbi:MAG: hypothetical protein ACLTX3_06760 [Lachnospiraceae bacterium]
MDDMGKFDITLIQTKESNEDSKEYKDAKRYLEEMQVANCILVADPDRDRLMDAHIFWQKKLSMELIAMGSFFLYEFNQEKSRNQKWHKGIWMFLFFTMHPQ